MALHFLDRSERDAESIREILAEYIEGPRLNAGGAPHAHGVADHDEGEENGDDKEVGIGAVDEGYRGREGDDEGAMAGGHAAGLPQKSEEDFFKGTRAVFEDIDEHFYKLSGQKADYGRKKDGISKEIAPVELSYAAHREIVTRRGRSCQGAPLGRRVIPMKAMRELKAGPDDGGRRLDRILKSLLPGVPLSAIYGGLRRGRIRVNGKKAKPDARVEEGDLIAIEEGLLGPKSQNKGERSLESQEKKAEAARRRLDGRIAFEGRDLLFIDKPKGMSAHGEGGLDLVVREALAQRMTESLAFSPGPLHRLDRNTSGLITFPKSMAGAQVFTELLREGQVRKRYLALLEGRLEEEASWEDLIARDEEDRVSRVSPEGSPALALARPLVRGSSSTLALIELRTGLTHQIRVQASSRGLPLEGDVKYGGRRSANGYLLHAWLLDFAEPPFEDIPRRVIAELPEEAMSRLASLFGREALEEALKRELLMQPLSWSAKNP
jgi:23S rRNA pseudouridine955/2504/2580 synthase